jgi:hypothetical protein
MAKWKCVRLWVLAGVLLSVGCDRLQDQPTPLPVPPPHLVDTTLQLDASGTVAIPLPNVTDLIAGAVNITYTTPAHGAFDFSQGAQGIVKYVAGPTFTTFDTASFTLFRANYAPTRTMLTFGKGALCIPLARQDGYVITTRPKVDLLNAHTIYVLANDEACPNSTLSFSATSAINPRFSLEGNAIRYQPDTSLSSQLVRDSVRYKICLNNRCTEATLLVTVEPALAPPCNLPFRAFSDTIDVLSPLGVGYRDTVSVLRILARTLRGNCVNAVNVASFRFDNTNPQYPLFSQGPGRNYSVENPLGTSPQLVYITRRDSGTSRVKVYFSVRKRNSLDASNDFVVFRYRP